jgi:ketosteroid isomerase-like protein
MAARLIAVFRRARKKIDVGRKEMKKVVAVVALCLAGCAPGLVAQATAKAAGNGDEAAIRAAVEGYRKAFEAKDVNAIMANYAPGNELFVFDAIPPRDYPSWDAYKKDWEGLFAAFPGPITDKISDDVIHVVGPVAYSHRIEETNFTKPDGTKQTLVVRVTDVYRKMNGKWLVVQEHVSFPVDLNTGQADLMSKP